MRFAGEFGLAVDYRFRLQPLRLEDGAVTCMSAPLPEPLKDMGESAVNLYAAGDHTFLSLLPQGTKAISSYCELNSQYVGGRSRRLPGCGPAYVIFYRLGPTPWTRWQRGSGSIVLCSVRTVPICLDFGDPDGSHSRCVQNARYTCAPGFVMNETHAVAKEALQRAFERARLIWYQRSGLLHPPDRGRCRRGR